MPKKRKQARYPPPRHAPLAALDAVVLDLETTGLDVRSDRVIQIAAIPMRGGKILGDSQLDQLINPGMPVPEVARRIHGLGDEDLKDAPALSDFFKTLLGALEGRVVIGHHVRFDLAILRHEAARLGMPWHDPPALDIAVLVGALDPWLPDLGLETITDHFGVTIEGRHSAIGDATATARIFAGLLPRLREMNVRTLGEAQTLTARRADLTLRQAEAGWDSVPEGATVPPREPAPIQVDSYVFERRLKDVMHAPPIFVPAEAMLRQAALSMAEKRIGALLVGAADRPPEGIVTERDLLKAIAAGTDFDRIPVRQVMTAPVESMPGKEMLYRALARMDRFGIRHLPVADEGGLAAGVVSQRDLLHHRTSSALVLEDALHEAHTPAELAAAYSRVPQVAAQLVRNGLSGIDIAHVISTELREVSARAAELAVMAMKTAGRGEPPAPWCLFLLGSAGRGESLLGADQDNAIIHAGHDADDAWFAELGGHIADYLDEAGIPRCKGGVMAVNAEWRGSREAWRARVEKWLSRADPKDLLNVDIFFDLIPVAGTAPLADQLRAEAIRAAAQATAFLGLLAQETENLTPRLGLFGGLKTDNGRVEMKRQGLLPVVNFARMAALKIGSAAHATPDRLRDAVAAGRVAESDAEAMIETHALALGLILRQQIADLDAGVRPSNKVAAALMSKAERDRLKKGLSRIEGVIGSVRSLMAGR